MSPRKKAAKKKKKAPIDLIVGIGALVIVFLVASFHFISSSPSDAQLRLEPVDLQTYSEARQLAAVEGDVLGAASRIDNAINNISEKSRNSKDIYTRAMLTIYKADLMLTYAGDTAEGFALLGSIYGDPKNGENARSQALSLAMAHALQGLDEGRLAVSQVRDYVLLNKNFKNVVGIGLADAMLLDRQEDTYQYLARGFTQAMEITSSQNIYALDKSYSLRLLSPFVLPPGTDSGYEDFIADATNFESTLDMIANAFETQRAAYQEFIATSYYNLARTYETLPPGSTGGVERMQTVHEKLSRYLAAHPESYGAQAYLVSISTRLVCKVVDNAGFDATRIDTEALQPYLDEVFRSEGWVVPCKEAFEVVAKDVDPRFAKYF